MQNILIRTIAMLALFGHLMLAFGVCAEHFHLDENTGEEIVHVHFSHSQADDCSEDSQHECCSIGAQKVAHDAINSKAVSCTCDSISVNETLIAPPKICCDCDFDVSLHPNSLPIYLEHRSLLM